MWTFRAILVAAILVAAMAGASLPAFATNLDPAMCERLIADHGRLATDDIRTELAKGPDWAKSNLSVEQIQDIEQIFEIEEKLAFRCPSVTRGPQKGSAATMALPKGVPGGAIEAGTNATKARGPPASKTSGTKKKSSSGSRKTGKSKARAIKSKRKKSATSDPYIPPKPGYTPPPPGGS